MMLNILQLPDEILLIIFEFLTTKNKLCLYNTCSRFRNLVIARSLSRKIVLSLSTLASSSSLKLAYIKNVSENIEELNLSGVQDLTKTSLIPALNLMRNLKSLNVAYTNIIIPDLIDKKLRTNLKKLTVNYVFTKTVSEIIVPNNILKASQDFLENIEDIHFVGSIDNLLYTRLLVYILNKCKNDIIITLTVLRNFNSAVYANTEAINFSDKFSFKYLRIYFPLLTDLSESYYDMKILNFSNFKLFDLNNLEYILILSWTLTNVVASDRFKNFIFENFNIHAVSTTMLNQLDVKYNSSLYFWNKDYNVFDETFLNNLKIKMQNLHPNYIEGSKFVTEKNDCSKCYIIKPSGNHLSKNCMPKEYSFSQKKVRLAPDALILDYDYLLKTNSDLKIVYIFGPTLSNYSLRPHLNYLSKIKVLSLEGDYILNSDFFPILFEKCKKLVTLNIVNCKSTCSKSISQSIQLSSSIKNLRICEVSIDFKILFQALSKVNALEAVQIVERFSSISNSKFSPNDIAPLILSCNNLYSLFIHKMLSNSAKTNTLRLVTKLKQKFCRNYLNVEVNIDKNNPFHSIGLNPFDIFLR